MMLFILNGQLKGPKQFQFTYQQIFFILIRRKQVEHQIIF
jgi:hypothetical protein